MMTRVAGVLLHPTSLPGPWGMGDFGPKAEAFLDWAASAGFGLWQILPLHPSAVAHSPYTTLSAFALDPQLISLERLVDDELLSSEDLPAEVDNPGRCDFRTARQLKAPLLRLAWQRFRERQPEELVTALADFRAEALQQAWLDDWCLFTALRRRHDDACWWTWEASLRDREAAALETVRQELADELAFEAFLQFLAFRHWRILRGAARERGIAVLGDVPIYVALDSAEVWARRQLFELDAEGQPTAVAGVPPDYFAEDGQLWGNPLYRWQTMAEDGFSWWVERLRANLALTDLVRLDHFRAFADFWRVPGDAETARDGSWQDGPGKPLFDAFAEQIGSPLPLIAEDLGDLSDKVHELRRAVGLPCMKVLHFGFDPPDSDHASFRLDPETLFYTGTHDNNTSVGWYRELSDELRTRINVFAGCGQDGAEPDDIHRHLIRLVLTSVARWTVVPMQDVVGAGSEARMNVPGVPDGNWSWRLRELPGDAEAAWLRPLIEVSGRLVSEDRD